MSGSDSSSVTQSLPHGISPQFYPEPGTLEPDGQGQGGDGGWRSRKEPGLHAKALGCTSEGPKEPRERALTWPQEAMSKIAGLHGEMTWPGARRPLCSSVARLATEVTAISGLAWW